MRISSPWEPLSDEELAGARSLIEAAPEPDKFPKGVAAWQVWLTIATGLLATVDQLKRKANEQ